VPRQEEVDVLLADEDLNGPQTEARWARDLRIRSLAGVIMALLRYSATARPIRALHRNYFVATRIHLGHAHGVMVEPVGLTYDPGRTVIFAIATISRAWSGRMTKGWSKLDELMRTLSLPASGGPWPRRGNGLTKLMG
jgi:hypothetical protein